MADNGWKKEFPTEEGKYWFYGYRYGRISCGTENHPELMFASVYKCRNGFIYQANGQFLFKAEVEDAYFKKAELPEIPEFFKEKH